jgi:hypothetical protein
VRETACFWLAGLLLDYNLHKLPPSSLVNQLVDLFFSDLVYGLSARFITPRGLVRPVNACETLFYMSVPMYSNYVLASRSHSNVRELDIYFFSLSRFVSLVTAYFNLNWPGWLADALCA